ncbi:hypothetical protein PTW37_14170 [Arthrobacter agilis]|nr:hypothetical protein [Arthrobacter agilis]WDF32984.1 hypothetical protein PTW37_14170 [Arthrobacter agilis]
MAARAARGGLGPDQVELALVELIEPLLAVTSIAPAEPDRPPLG